VVTPRRLTGDFGERLALQHLRQLGLGFVAQNVRTRSGEIDIVCTDGDDTVFVEVRTRRAAPGAAAESITDAKLERMWRCAMDYCETNGSNPEQTRLDLVVVELNANGTVSQVLHFPALELPAE
jgi:putative endonuclease